MPGRWLRGGVRGWARARRPGGGTYVWNEAWRTLESTVYGHPLAPREGPVLPAELRELRSAEAGHTFEEEAVRARMALQR